jgi:DNA-binding GntR family transcriptional regulator
LGGKKNDPASRLRDAITSGHFMPNERLVETELAAFLGTNRANVRTALARLEQEGLVVSEPNRGARVRLVSEAEAIEITEARGALEVLVARQAARRATEGERDELREILRAMEAAVETGDLIAYSSANGKLHAALQRIARHATATRLLATLKSQIVRFQFRAILIPGRAPRSLGEHRAIVEAVCARDPEAAALAMARHLENVVGALSQAIEAGKTVAV